MGTETLTAAPVKTEMRQWRRSSALAGGWRRGSSITQRLGDGDATRKPLGQLELKVCAWAQQLWQLSSGSRELNFFCSLHKIFSPSLSLFFFFCVYFCLLPTAVIACVLLNIKSEMGELSEVERDETWNRVYAALRCAPKAITEPPAVPAVTNCSMQLKCTEPGASIKAICLLDSHWGWTRCGDVAMWRWERGSKIECQKCET